MKQGILISAIAVLAVMGTAAIAADPIGNFNIATGGDIDGKRAEHYAPDFGQPAAKPAKSAKYGEFLFNGANGPVYQRAEKDYTGQPNASIASAQCDFSLGTNNTPSFGKCPKERAAERILDKDGTNYSSPVREVRTLCPNGSEIFHTGPCGSGQ